jgi:hypothetical protein
MAVAKVANLVSLPICPSIQRRAPSWFGELVSATDGKHTHATDWKEAEEEKRRAFTEETDAQLRLRLAPRLRGGAGVDNTGEEV